VSRPHRANSTRSLHKQRGWLGLLALVFALLIVGVMAKFGFKQYGAYFGDTTGAGSKERAQAAQGMARDDKPVDVLPAPQNPMEQVRNLRERVQREVSGMGDRADDVNK